MLLKTFWRALLAVAAIAPDLVPAADDNNGDTPHGQSTFISPGGDLAFGFTVPDDNTADVYFSLRVSAKRSWGAVGLGNNQMSGALFLMIYRDRSGNVTFSPRLAYGNYEPQYYADVVYDVLNGTGIVDGYMLFTARCRDRCRNWPARGSSGGFIDVNSPNQKAIYAIGPQQTFRSDSASADLKFHSEYGSFTIDMKRTFGSPDAPHLTSSSKSVGTTLDSRTTGKSDWKAALHATFMVFCIMAMLPAGVALLRFGRWVKWHASVQTVALIGVLAGLSMGVLTSFHYQRSRSFSSAHQVLGFIVVGFLLGQFILGLLHHAIYRRTKSPTRYGQIHVWLGRISIALGIINAFLGFSFAVNRMFGLILAGVFILIIAIVVFCILGRQWKFLEKKFPPRGPLHSTSTAYQPQPWRDDQAPGGDLGASERPDGYNIPPQQIGLERISSPPPSPSPWKSSEGKKYSDDPDLGDGSVQRPREFA